MTQIFHTPAQEKVPGWGWGKGNVALELPYKAL